MVFSITKNPNAIPKINQENLRGISKNERNPTPPKNDKSKIEINFAPTVRPVRHQKLHLPIYQRLYSVHGAHGQNQH